MKFTKNWLLDYLEPNCSFNDILNGLLNLGLEVENTIDYTSKLKDFSVAEILETKKHENAQKLQVCKVNTKYGIKQIVCGAPNARNNIKVVFANIGTYIPGTDITLKDIEIRGIKSSGMLVSEMELGISTTHSGIIEISDKFSVGVLASTALNLDDTLIEVAITPNLGHLLSVKAIAKSLSALGLGTFKEQTYPFLIKNIPNGHQNYKYTSNQISSLETENNSLINITSNTLSATINKEICPAGVIVKLENCNNNIQTPLTIASRLKLIGQELINPITDILNYLTVDINHPIGAYDYSKLTNKNINLSIDFANNKDTIIASNNKEYTDLSEIALVKLNNNPVSIAGIIGGIDNIITNNSKEIILECLYFDPIVIAKSSKTLSINTNTSYHFKRGVNPLDLLESTNLALNLITEACGSNISDIIAINTIKEYKTVETTFTYINNILGTQINKDKILNYLKKQEFIVSYNEDTIIIKVPCYRNDIEQECDIAAVILSFYGINNIPVTSINKLPLLDMNNQTKKCTNNTNNTLVSGNSSYKTTLLVKKILSSLGLLENINMSFISEDIAKLFDIYNPSLELSNPISNELKVMRQSLLPSLTKTIANNLRQGYGDLKFFEVSNVFHDLNTVSTNVAIILSGYKYKKDWRHNTKLYDVFDSKDILFNLISLLGLDPNKFKISKNNLPSYTHIGQSGVLLLGNQPLAYFGTLHPKITQYFNLKESPAFFELFLNTLPVIKHKSNIKIQDFSKQMPLERDFAFIVDKNIPAVDVINTIRNINKKLISHVRVFDVFNYPDNKKSLGFTVIINPKQTLTELEINDLSQNIITAVTNKIGGILRDKK